MSHKIYHQKTSWQREQRKHDICDEEKGEGKYERKGKRKERDRERGWEGESRGVCKK